MLQNNQLAGATIWMMGHALDCCIDGSMWFEVLTVPFLDSYSKHQGLEELS